MQIKFGCQCKANVDVDVDVNEYVAPDVDVNVQVDVDVDADKLLIRYYLIAVLPVNFLIYVTKLLSNIL